MFSLLPSLRTFLISTCMFKFKICSNIHQLFKIVIFSNFHIWWLTFVYSKYYYYQVFFPEISVPQSQWGKIQCSYKLHSRWHASRVYFMMIKYSISFSFWSRSSQSQMYTMAALIVYSMKICSNLMTNWRDLEKVKKLRPSWISILLRGPNVSNIFNENLTKYIDNDKPSLKE